MHCSGCRRANGCFGSCSHRADPTALGFIRLRPPARLRSTAIDRVCLQNIDETIPADGIATYQILSRRKPHVEIIRAIRRAVRGTFEFSAALKERRAYEKVRAGGSPSG